MLHADPSMQIHAASFQLHATHLHAPCSCVIEHDIAFAAILGADGVVIGALTADGLVDVDITRRFLGAARSAVGTSLVALSRAGGGKGQEVRKQGRGRWGVVKGRKGGGEEGVDVAERPSRQGGS